MKSEQRFLREEMTLELAATEMFTVFSGCWRLNCAAYSIQVIDEDDNITGIDSH